MRANRFDFVLFDLGGVLVQLRGASIMRELAGLDSDDEVWSRWLSCPWVRSFEMGTCSPGEFAAGLVAEWGLAVSPASFLEHFRKFPEALYDGAAELVSAVRQQVKVGCLSNSNTLHWELMNSLWDLAALFDFAFLSHQIGLVKPDRAVFDYVVEHLGAQPPRVVFLDDNRLNVAGAAAAGLTAVQAQGADEARLALAELGVLAESG